MKNKKLKAILSITGYFLLTIALCISASIVFHNVYYESVYISGSSMAPTLQGSTMTPSGYGFDVEKEGSIVDFGIVDTHQSAIDHVKRFSIISTYYHTDYNSNETLITGSNEKIKRVIAMPNETFKIENSKLYIKGNNGFEYVPYTFDIEPALDDGYTGKDIGETTLNDNEYWVLGDHRDKSHDCGSSDMKRPIKKNYISGVLVAIEGKAKIKIKECQCTNCGATYSKGVICGKCGATLNQKFELVEAEYHWPIYF